MKKTTMPRMVASVLTGLATLALSSGASAQYARGPRTPSSGACFYEDIDFGGRYFCTPVGDSTSRVPSNVNDEISSIRVFGNAEVVVFRDGNMNGEARRFTTSVRDLRRSGFNDRMTSYVVQPRGYAGTRGGAYGDRYGYGDPYGYGGSSRDGRYNGGDPYGRGGHGYDPYAARGGYGSTPYDGAYRNDRAYRGTRDGAGGRLTHQEAESMVRLAYRRVFGREPDPAARSWVNEVVKNGWSQRQLEAALWDTPEGRSR